MEKKFSEIKQIRREAEQGIHAAKTLAELEAIEVRYLGRKGVITQKLGRLGSLSREERQALGEAINQEKAAVQAAVALHRETLQRQAYAQLAEREWIDVTQPGTPPPDGHLHLVTQAIREITRLFERIGFYRRRYPEVEWDWYAFESLNMPEGHPARDEWETFFMDTPAHPKYGRLVLTPHTSNGQVREMELAELPIRLINISKCYRRQSDVSHVPMFHQFEGLLIDQEVSITHLKGVLDYFAREFFGSERKTRLRPFHFRFTEPSFEVDISCGVCGGTGFLAPPPSMGEEKGAGGQGVAKQEKCRLCKSGWLELGGAGMVHPNVLKAGGIDPHRSSGFAFGWGVERTIMMRSGLRIDDIRLIYKNDLRFLRQF